MPLGIVHALEFMPHLCKTVPFGGTKSLYFFQEKRVMQNFGFLFKERPSDSLTDTKLYYLNCAFFSILIKYNAEY